MPRYYRPGRSFSVTTCIYVQPEGPGLGLDGADELEVTVKGDVSKFVPGRYSGPPEKCYPDEGGEIELTEATLDGKAFWLSTGEDDKAVEALREAATDYESEEPDYEPDDYHDDVRNCHD